MNVLPRPGPSLETRDAPAVHLDELLDHGQPDAQPPLGPGRRTVPLGEQVEDAREQVGPDADARVGHPDDRVARLPRGLHLDPAARLGVLGRVVEQVDQDLLEPDRVGLELDRLGGEREAKLVPALVDQRADGLGRRADDGRPARRAAGRSWILPRLIRETSSRSSTRRVSCRTCRSMTSRHQSWTSSASGVHQELDGVGDRGERIAQLMGQHGQELVLPPALLGDPVLRPPPLGHVAEDQHHAVHAPAGAPDRGAAVVDRPLGAVPGDQQRMVGQADDHPLAQHALRRALDRSPGSAR